MDTCAAYFASVSLGCGTKTNRVNGPDLGVSHGRNRAASLLDHGGSCGGKPKALTSVESKLERKTGEESAMKRVLTVSGNQRE